MRNLYLIFALLLGILMKSQIFVGDIFIFDHSELYLNQVYVTNLKEHRTVLSDFNGQFKISAKPGDVIRFTSIITDRKDVTVTQAMLDATPNVVELKIAYHEIEEVFISRFKPTGHLRKDLAMLKPKRDHNDEIKKMIGLPRPKGDGTSPQLPAAAFAGGGLTFSIDAIYDILSGERKKKERLQAYERMNYSISNMKDYFGKSYFTKLKIPENLIDNFLQFVYTSDDIQHYIAKGDYEATGIYIEKYLPVYQKRLQNSHLIEVLN